MAAITSDWAPVAAEAPTIRAAKHTKEYSREEEFHSALESYIAGYQEHWSGTIDPTDCVAHKTYVTPISPLPFIERVTLVRECGI